MVRRTVSMPTVRIASRCHCCGKTIRLGREHSYSKVGNPICSPRCRANYDAAEADNEALVTNTIRFPEYEYAPRGA